VASRPSPRAEAGGPGAEAETIGRLSAKRKFYLKPNVLVVDEVGYLPLARDEANLVFQTISKRYERGSMNPFHPLMEDCWSQHDRGVMVGAVA
jgi:DNA replication protein DnaC